MSLISIVVPLYNEEGNVAELVRRIAAICERVLLPGERYEIVAVNDGSRDATLPALRASQLQVPQLTIVDLSRNFGHQIAATAGLDQARGDAVILMDGDLQDPPELIGAFLEKWREGYDVVYATRRTRKGESKFKLLTAALFYRTIRRLTNVSIPVDTGDFRLMSRRVIDALGQAREKHRFLRGLVSWVGYKQIGVEYERDPRHAGETKYPLSKMLKFAVDGITSFSEIPLRFATYLGFPDQHLRVRVRGDRLGRPFLRPQRARLHLDDERHPFPRRRAAHHDRHRGEYLGRIYDQVKSRPLYLLSSVEPAPASAARELSESIS